MRKREVMLGDFAIGVLELDRRRLVLASRHRNDLGDPATDALARELPMPSRAPPTGSGLGYDRVEHYTRARRRGRANVTTARTAMPANAEKDRPAAPSCRPRRGSSARQAEKFETQLAGIKRLQLAQHAMAAARQATARQAALQKYFRARSPGCGRSTLACSPIVCALAR